MEIPAGRYAETRGQIAEQRGKSRGNEEKPPFEIVGTEMGGLDEIAVALANEVDFPAGQSVVEEGLRVRSEQSAESTEKERKKERERGE